jgi:hypothetical protein
MRFPDTFVGHKEAMLLKRRYEEVINESLNRIDFTSRKSPRKVLFDDILAIEEEIEAFRIGDESSDDKPK